MGGARPNRVARSVQQNAMTTRTPPAWTKGSVLVAELTVA